MAGDAEHGVIATPRLDAEHGVIATPRLDAEHGVIATPRLDAEHGVIATPRLDLVPMRAEHAQEMARVMSDPALYEFIGGSPPTAHELRSRYRRWAAGSPDPAETWCNWVIRVRSEDCLAGTVQATISRSGGAMQAEIAWVVGAPWQGRGIATEAARGLVGWLGKLGVRTVIAHIHPDHHASAAVAAAAGLSPTGELHDGEVVWRRTAGDAPAVSP